MKPPILSRTTTRRAGSGLSTGGLLLVCVCFFLPFCRGCSEDIVPAHENIVTILVNANPYLLAYALAGLLLLGAAPRRRRRRRVVGIIILILCFLFLVANVFLISYVAIPSWNLVETLFFPAILFVNGGLLAGVVIIVARRKAWRWRNIIPWSGLSVCLPATVYFLWWEWMVAARYGLHLTVLGFAAATAGFWLLLLHHRAARRWTLMRWHRSRLRTYHNSLSAGAT